MPQSGGAMERHMDKHGEGHRAMVRGVEWPVPGQVLPPFDAWRSAAVAADVIQAQHAGAQALEQRRALGCTSLAHGFAAAPAGDKIMLRELQRPNLAIVSAYNDMLSAH